MHTGELWWTETDLATPRRGINYVNGISYGWKSKTSASVNEKYSFKLVRRIRYSDVNYTFKVLFLDKKQNNINDIRF